MADAKLFNVSKHCPQCRKDWKGWSFAEDDGTVEAYCDDCADAVMERAHHSESLGADPVPPEELEQPKLSPELEEL